MRNVKRFLGIIALVAVMGCFMTACGEDEPPAPEPKGLLNIEAGEYGPFVNYPQVAVYAKDEDDPDYVEVTFVWFKADDVTTVKNATLYSQLTSIILAEDTDTYTLNTTGFLIVAAYRAAEYSAAKDSAGQNTPSALPGPLISSSFEVKSAPSYTRFYGTWLMNGDLQTPPWYPETNAQGQPLPGVPTSGNTETLTITYKNFKLDSNYQKASTTETEKIYWSISSWSEITGAGLLGVKHGDPAVSVDYNAGATLSGTVTKNVGYGTFTSFRIYLLDSSGQLIMRRTNGTAANSAVIVRTYVKQP